MRILIVRNGQVFGPYPVTAIQEFLGRGKIYLQDMARIENDPGNATEPLEKILARHAPQVLSAVSALNPLTTISQLGVRFLFPIEEIKSLKWLKDPRFIYLAVAGLAPYIITRVSEAADLHDSYVMIAGFFSVVWAFVLFVSFRTPQTEVRDALIAYIFTAFVALGFWRYYQTYSPLAGITYPYVKEPGIRGLWGCVFGVGLHEELAKAAIIFYLARRPGKLFMPQTIVFYGLMSGLAFGIREGAERGGYIDQYLEAALRKVADSFLALKNKEIDAGQCIATIQLTFSRNFISNILRLSSLPLLHAAWTGIASYFIAFAALRPRHRWGLWILALLLPATLHGFFDHFCFTDATPGIAIVLALSFVLLAVYLRNATNLQKQLATA